VPAVIVITTTSGTVSGQLPVSRFSLAAAIL